MGTLFPYPALCRSDRPRLWPRRQAHHRPLPARRIDRGDRLPAQLRVGRGRRRAVPRAVPHGPRRRARRIVGRPRLAARLERAENKRGWYAMIPQLGAPLGLIVASLLFMFLISALPAEDFLAWGWRYPFFVAFAINVVALFARLR